MRSTYYEGFIMHDIDRTQMEFNPAFGNSGGRSYEFGEQESSGEAFETFETSETFGETILSEAQEMELASELLRVNNEAELEQFLGNVFKSVANVAGGIIRSPIGKAVGGVLKGVAKKALPLAGGALGGFFGGPLGASIGSGLASAAGNALGLEAEMLEQEDREFEGAKQFVRVAADTIHRAATAPASSDPHAAAQAAAIESVRRLAPGLLSGGSPGGAPVRAGVPATGHWTRRGNKIVLHGV
ncbi:hypothetical protein [Paraburkholderia sp. UCT31]|uniref:hypothetical protein n=1 Tax=Paraburkholderia sp. UCT31 TaxID=2615209 RepID=UPI001CA4684E|nr:hypothetical protein [Paraburkholderia sp. UCT31]